MDFFRDPFWQFVGVSLAALGLLVSIVIYLLQKQRREVAFGLVSDRSVLAVAADLSHRVQILFDGTPVANIRLLVVGLKNSGEKAILPSDFDRPLSIEFGEGSLLLEASVTRQSPPNLKATIAFSDSSVTLSPLLLNAGDFVVIQALVSAATVTVRADTRIVGVSRLEALNSGPRVKDSPTYLLKFFGATTAFFGLFALLAYNKSEMVFRPGASSTNQIVGVAFIAMLPLLLFFITVFPQWIMGRLKNTSRRYIDDA